MEQLSVAQCKANSREVFIAMSILACSCAWMLFVSSGIGEAIHIQEGPSLAAAARGPSPAKAVCFPGCNLTLSDVVFVIGSTARFWSRRKELVRLWWRPGQMRGFVWLEEPVPSEPDLPSTMVSQDTSRYITIGNPTGIRMALVFLETFRLGLPDVKWFVMSDDDTIFCVENLIRVLSKHDHREMHYVGSPSEVHPQNRHFSHEMAFGGAGFAISYALAEALAANDMAACIRRYPGLVGGDDRVHACVLELGIPLTHEPGFHQCDIRGDVRGFFSAHPIVPFVSMHHIDSMAPFFPSMSRIQGLWLLTKAMRVDPAGFMQQTICYDREHGLSFSLSMGYMLQVIPEIMYRESLSRAELTFWAWVRVRGRKAIDFDTRISGGPCRQGLSFYLHEIDSETRNQSSLVVSTYHRHAPVDKMKKSCRSTMFLPDQVQAIQVESTPLTMDWYKVPRRQCCKIRDLKKEMLQMSVSPCASDMDAAS